MVLRTRTPFRALVGLLLATVVVGCGGGANGTTDPGGGAHGRWTDPGARLVDGLWIGPQIACPPARDECVAISTGARSALSEAERAEVARVQWVSLPTHFVTDGGEPRTARLAVGIDTWAAALVTLRDGRERAVGLDCYLPHTSGGRLETSAASCRPAALADWQDGAVPPSLPPVVVPG
jgi:hypothetical protein